MKEVSAYSGSPFWQCGHKNGDGNACPWIESGGPPGHIVYAAQKHLSVAHGQILSTREAFALMRREVRGCQPKDLGSPPRKRKMNLELSALAIEVRDHPEQVLARVWSVPDPSHKIRRLDM